MEQFYLIACIVLLVGAFRLSKKGYGVGGHLLVVGSAICLASPVIGLLGPTLGICQPHHPRLVSAILLLWSGSCPAGLTVIAIGMLVLAARIPAGNTPPNDRSTTEARDE